MSERIYSHRNLIVYQKSFAAGRRIFELSKEFPREEMYSLTDQLRRSARSVSANIAEAWRKRRYKKHFCSTLNIAEAEAAETQVWLDYAAAHGYLDQDTAKLANDFYDEILRMIVAMISAPEKWCIGKEDTERGGQGDAVKEMTVEYALAVDQERLLSLSPPPSHYLSSPPPLSHSPSPRLNIQEAADA